jgi:2-oxoglutarate dehydrogenase E1 component
MSNYFPEQTALPGVSADGPPPQAASSSTHVSAAQIAGFIDAYRNHGYRIARLDPLGLTPLPEAPELSLRFHGLDPAHAQMFDKAVFFSALTVEQLERQLERVYCGAIGLDCSGIRSEARRSWLFAHMESESLSAPAMPDERLGVLRRLLAAEMWERHVAAKYGHAKRFSLEGCESLVPVLDALIEHSSKHGIRQMFLGMPHRGRLNALVNVMDIPAEEMLARLDHDSDLAAMQKDLPYHFGGTAHKQTAHGEVSVCLAHNPSHLQSVYPIVSGMARAYNDEHRGYPCVPVVVHGDAAFAGQGIVMETLNMTQKAGYALGGTIHVIVNNQIGFTTPNFMDVRASVYCTDVARMIDAPVIHVNADHPDEVLRAVKLAFDYRMEHGADVVIDLIGYRRLGHSEHDIPAITQPFLQAAIACHPSVTELYHVAIAAPAPLDDLRAEALQNLQTQLPQSQAPVPASTPAKPAVKPLRQPLSLERLQSLTAAATRPPAGVVLHDFVRNLTGKWQAAVTSEHNTIDWCFAENMAYASLVEDGQSIRLSGMDVGRGTFMHRHAVWHAQDCLSGVNNIYIPLKHIAPHQGSFDIVNSPLTEEAVLGFEYGYSVQSKTRLTIWEAQFGDFVNGAQVMIDQYIVAGEYKWGYQSALTVLLPHGHEGVGPEHSNAYLGRFLQLCADHNLRVAVPSTSVQWFHLLREQAGTDTPKPLVVMSPKSQLYGNARSHSPLRELIEGAYATILRDAGITTPAAVDRVILCSGKFLYELEAAREALGHTGTALIRIEQLYPFPKRELADALAEFSNLREVVWAQEEDRNQGAWRFVREELEEVLPAGCRLSDVCRTATASGAHSSLKGHQQEQRRLVAAALGQA